MNNHQRKLWGFIFFGALLLIFSPAQASFVSPKRVMIDEGKNTAVLIVSNTNVTPMAYTFTWERRAQTPNGGESILLKEGETSPGYRPADPYLLFSPRRVVVNPGETQQVRIFARRTPDMQDGEYHSHITVMGEKTEDAKAMEVDRGLGGSIGLRTGLSIPVFLRKGKTTIQIVPQEVSLKRDNIGPYVSFIFENKSTRSFYGLPMALCYTAASAEPVEAMLPTIRAYVEARQVVRRLPFPPGFDVNQCQSIKLRISALSDFEYKSDEPILLVDIQK